MKQMERDQARMDSLTSLRFFAAFEVLLYHVTDLFAIPGRLPQDLEYPQGVTFFFILSGFILTFVYGRMNSFLQAKEFWLKRLARLWPLHVFWLLMMICFLPPVALISFKEHLEHLPVAFVANLFMVQTFLPSTQYSFAFNPPSWSIADEAFFYLVFPFTLLLYRAKNVFLKMLPILVPLMMVAIFVTLAYELNVPIKDIGLSQQSLVFVNPLVRIFEFNVGILLAFLFAKTKNVFQGKVLLTSFIEVFLLIYVLASVLLTPYARLVIFNFNQPLAYWFDEVAIVIFPFSLLILFCAYGQGIVSKILKAPPLVFLGEISFSLYLCHFPILLFYRYRLPQARSDADFFCFLAACFVASYLGYRFIEKPAREFIARKLAAKKSSQPIQCSLDAEPENTCRHSDQKTEPDKCPGK